MGVAGVATDSGTELRTAERGSTSSANVSCARTGYRRRSIADGP